MIYKILVAVDYSENSKFVFDTAVSLAKTTDATLMILNVLAEYESGYPEIPSYYDRSLYLKQFEAYRQKGIDFLQQKAEAAKQAGVRTEFVQLTGNPGREICTLASTWAADLILVGSRGLKGLKEMFLGSVSNYVTHHAPCSVLILRSNIDSESESTSNRDER
ncbi:MAG: universal stress protein [Pleurocapsa sp. MO_226.B13]|nr:universal stress protein [Pleurocapsa sp. MO_226.B13]